MFIRLFAVTLLTALTGSFASAQQRTFATGQAAVTVLGQFDFTQTFPGPEAHEMGSPNGLARAGNRLIVSDGGFLFTTPQNHRVLIFNDSSLLGPGRGADVVIGQAGFGFTCGTGNQSSCSIPAAGQAGMNKPVGVASDGTRLAVADAGNNRILIYNTIPTRNGANADVVLGQPDFNVILPTTTQTGLRFPNGVWFDGGRLFVADTQNNRVLIFSSVPTANNAQASVVIGQADFTSNKNDGNTASLLHNPVAVTSDGVRMIVTDLGSNRVLIYNRIPTTSGAAADVVVGQPDFTTVTAGTSSGKLNFPRYAYSDGTSLYIADSGNNRVLIYNTIPTTNGALPDTVIGQTEFNSVQEGVASEKLALPVALLPSDNGILVADVNNRRVLDFRRGVPMIRQWSIVNAFSFGGNGLARPSGVAATCDTSTGNLPAGTYFLRVTAQNNFPRESAPSEEVPVTCGATGRINVSWSAVTGATAYRVYAGVFAGLQDRFYSIPTSFDGTAPATTLLIDNYVTSPFYGTLTVTGANPKTGDVVNVTVKLTTTSSFSSTYTVKDGDTLVTIAAGVAAAIKDNTANTDTGVNATSDGPRIYVSLKSGNTTGITYLGAVTKVEGSDLAITPTADTTLGSDTDPAGPGFGVAGFNISLVPGGLATIFGSDLAPQAVAIDTGVLPLELAGTSVLVNGQAAPLKAASPGQVTFQLPAEVSGNSASIQIRKRSNGQETLSVAVPVNVTDTEPALYSLDGSGTGTALALRPDGSLVSADNPLQVGEEVTLFGTGYGLMADRPLNVQVTSSETGGQLIPGTYFVRITSIYADGRESLGAGDNQVSAFSGNTNKISFTWDADPNAVSYRIYVGTRARGFDRYYESTTNSFDLVSIFGKAGRPPIQTNVPGNGTNIVATTIASILQGFDMPIISKGVASNRVGYFEIKARIPEITRADLGLADGQIAAPAELHMVVGAIDSNHLFLPLAVPPLGIFTLSGANPVVGDVVIVTIPLPALGPQGTLTFSGTTPVAGDVVTVTIVLDSSTTITATYTVKAGETLSDVTAAVAAQIAANTSNGATGVNATSDATHVFLTYKRAGTTGVTYSASVTQQTGSNLAVTPTTSATLTDNPGITESYTVKGGEQLSDITAALAQQIARNPNNGENGVNSEADAFHLYISYKKIGTSGVTYIGRVDRQAGSDLAITPTDFVSLNTTVIVPPTGVLTLSGNTPQPGDSISIVVALNDTTNFIVTYVVRAGDTVATITRALGTAMKADAGNGANGVLVVYNGNKIYLNRKDPQQGTITYFGVVTQQPGSDLAVSPGTATALSVLRPARVSGARR